MTQIEKDEIIKNTIALKGNKAVAEKSLSLIKSQLLFLEKPIKEADLFYLAESLFTLSAAITSWAYACRWENELSEKRMKVVKMINEYAKSKVPDVALKNDLWDFQKD